MIEDLAQEAVKRSLPPGARVTERQAALDAAREAVKLTLSHEPDEQPAPDLRANAWMGAWDRIESAQKLKAHLTKTARKRVAPEALPEIYWSMMVEAQILADLARADQDTGNDVGAIIVARDQRARAERERFEALFGAAQERTATKHDPEPTFAAGQRVRMVSGPLASFYGRHGTVVEPQPGGTLVVDFDARAGGPRRIMVEAGEVELLPPAGEGDRPKVAVKHEIEDRDVYPAGEFRHWLRCSCGTTLGAVSDAELNRAHREHIGSVAL